MELIDLLNQTSEWLKGTGPESDIVMSSRIRLARNLIKLPFSHWAKREDKEKFISLIKDCIFKYKQIGDFLFVKIDSLEDIDKDFLIERHLISKEHAIGKNEKAAIVNDKETLSIMINEEDHLRIQTMQSGFNLTRCWDLINSLDQYLSKHLDYAFSEEWGYLTACPTNAGTGMRASIMLHLPALVMSQQMNKILQVIAKLNLIARGFYGEGTQAKGNFFQISNQSTLGQSEYEIIDNITRVIKQIINQEKSARRAQLTHNRAVLENKTWRAYGLLQNARIISSSETIELLSDVRLGVDIGIIKHINRKLINQLFILIQPAHLQKLENKRLSTSERDVKRAEIIREKLRE